MKPYTLIRLMAVTMFVVALSSTAEAQATRTWVSGVGDDANPCSRTAPCKTFAGAISKTAKDGEINCLNPGGYGAVTITKSITIDCEDTQGSILSAGSPNAVVINITDINDIRKTVRLRGISVNGASTGTDGIKFLAGNALFLDEMVVDGMTAQCLEVNVGAITSRVFVRNSSFRNCVGDGAFLQAAVGGLIIAEFNNSWFTNSGDGLESGARTRSVLNSCYVASNTSAGVRASGTADVDVNIQDSTISYNPDGVRVDLGTARVAGSVVSGNTTGLRNVGGTLKSFQSSNIDSNGTNKIGVTDITGQ